MPTLPVSTQIAQLELRLSKTIQGSLEPVNTSLLAIIRTQDSNHVRVLALETEASERRDKAKDLSVSRSALAVTGIIVLSSNLFTFLITNAHLVGPK